MIHSLKAGKRLLTLLLILLTVLALSVPAMAAQHSIPDTARTSLVRFSPYEGSTVIGQLAHGTELTVLDETRDYYKIDCSGMNGYIRKTQTLRDEDGTLRVSARVISPDTASVPAMNLADTMQFQSDLTDLAARYLGVPYVYGGAGPYGFDCSGFVYYTYGKLGIDLLRSADVQMREGIVVPRDSLQPGDLVFFRAYGPWLCSHVGIYVGDNHMIHASSDGICYSDLDMPYYANSYVGARRIVQMRTEAAAAAGSLADNSALMGRAVSGIRTAG